MGIWANDCRLDCCETPEPPEPDCEEIEDNYLGWDFENIWRCCGLSTYPKLRWLDG